MSNVSFLKINQSTVSQGQVENIMNEHFSKMLSSLENQGFNFAADENFYNAVHLSQEIIVASLLRTIGQPHDLQMVIDHLLSPDPEE